MTPNFWNRVNKDGPIPPHVPHLGKCWEWTGGLKRGGGYGDLSINGEIMRAHRYSWQINVGDIPDGKFVLHKCDNRKCVNPSHLFIGDDADNVRDRVQKGRSADQRGEKSPSAKLTTDQVLEIRNSTTKLSVLAKRFNVTYENTWKIRTGRAWAHLNNPSQL